MDDPRIRITLKIIEEQRSSLQLTLADTSRMLGLSEAYLLRLFHRQVGKTFRQHLLQTRMVRAADLLTREIRPVKQIALDCGYNDVSNFYRDFRKVHGATPQQVRTNHLRQHTNDLIYIAQFLPSTSNTSDPIPS